MKLSISVGVEQFTQELETFKHLRPELAHNIGDVPANARYHIHADGETVYGYAITWGGELRCVFSKGKGKGKELVAKAITHGAKRLDCFDGYLVNLYSQAGFVETSRSPNWTEGEPDVVYMELA